MKVLGANKQTIPTEHSAPKLTVGLTVSPGSSQLVSLPADPGSALLSSCLCLLCKLEAEDYDCPSQAPGTSETLGRSVWDDVGVWVGAQYCPNLQNTPLVLRWPAVFILSFIASRSLVLKQNTPGLYNAKCQKGRLSAEAFTGNISGCNTAAQHRFLNGL